MKGIKLVIITALLIVTAAAVAKGEKVSFDGHRVIEVKLKSEAERDVLMYLPGEETDGVQGVDVWTHSSMLLYDPIEPVANTVRLTPQGFARFTSAAERLGMEYKIITKDLGATLKLREKTFLGASLPESRKHVVGAVGYDPVDDWYYHWHSFDEIQTKIKELADKYPEFVSFYEIGKSHEGRVFGGVLISSGQDQSSEQGEAPKTRVALIAGTHAREWIAEGVAMWAIGSLVEQYIAKDPEITKLLQSLEIYIVPCYNPDGYEYSRVTNRYWRKNRRDNGDGSFGVDQNRNWDANWGGPGSSSATTSDVYCGPYVLSEPEPLAVHDWLKGLVETGGVSSSIDFHSMANLVMRPWAYTNDTCAEDAELKQKGDTFVSIVNKVRGNKYKSVRGADLYICSGSAGDGTHILGIKSAYVIELSGSDFVVPEKEIQFQGEEMFEGLKYFFASA